MSTYVYLVCKEHKESVALARIGMFSVGPLAGDEDRFPFIGKHVGCEICVMDEHQLDQVEYGDFKRFSNESS